jgi:sporulation protein YlmC with PRC-barrel domain
LGEIQDLAIDAEQGRVAYAVLSFGGVLKLGDKWFAIPTGALTLPDDCKQFVLAVEKDRLKSAPGFAKNSWPKMDDVRWGTETHKFYGQKPYWMYEGDDATPTAMRIQKASDIIGRKVQNDQGEKLGEIKDLVIDPDRYRVSYAVLTFGGFMGLGDKLFAMPASVLEMQGAGDYAVLTVDKDRLKSAKGFDQDNWPNLADSTFAASTYEFYGQKPYWLEDLRGGRYLASAAGQECHECGHTTVMRGFVREGETYCCAGCANQTGCTCAPVADGSTH